MPSWSEKQTIQAWFKKHINQHIAEYKSQWCVLIFKEGIFVPNVMRKVPTHDTLMHGRTTSFQLSRKANAFGQE